MKIARRKTAWGAKGSWLIIPGVAAIGAIAWAIATFWAGAVPDGTSDNFSELGAAIAGGAIVGIAVLLVQLRFENESRNKTVQFELGLQEKISGLDLRCQDLRDSYLLDKKLANANLSRARFDGSVLWRCDFTGTFLFGTSFTGANLKYANFDGTSLSGADFTGADLTGAKLSGAFFNKDKEPHTKEPFGAANLSGAILVRADLRTAILVGVKLVDADLREADLEGANLRGAVLTGAKNLDEAKNLDNATYDSSTIWPDGFSPS